MKSFRQNAHPEEEHGSPGDAALSRLSERHEDAIEVERLVARARYHGRELREQIEQLKRQIGQLESRIAKGDRMLENAASDFQRLAQDNAVLLAEVARLERVTARMQASKSWTMTVPVRWLGAKIRDVRGWITGYSPAPVDDETASALPVPPPPAPPVDEVEEISTDTAIRERLRILEAALEDQSAEAGEVIAAVRYVHRVNDRVDARRLQIKAIVFYAIPWASLPGESRSATPGSCWGNVAKAIPRYVGQYQPRLPGDLGFYDLRYPGFLREQVALAKQYGVYGICFDYYSPGSVPGLSPLDQLLEDREIEIPFCIRWRPGSGEDTFPGSLLNALSDPRYIRVDQRPVLIIYGAGGLARPEEAVRSWRSVAVDSGLPGLFIVAMDSSKALTEAGGFDAGIADPSLSPGREVTEDQLLIDPSFSGRVFRYAEVMDQYTQADAQPSALFQHVMTGWDDEALRPGSGSSLAGASPALYARWLSRSCQLTMSRRPEERLLFVSSWNDWARGAYLEPDRRFGYAYLHGTANVLRYYHRDPSVDRRIEDIAARFVPTSRAAIVLHCYYEELIDTLFDRYLPANLGADLFVTVRSDVSLEAIEKIIRKFPNTCFLRYENRGRDIRPFLLVLRSLRSFGYEIACKVHTKRTPQAEDGAGERWRERLWDQLLGLPDSLQSAVDRFSREPDLGLLVPAGSIMTIKENHYHLENMFWLDKVLTRMQESELIAEYPFSFPAGSMYWFRVEALAGFDELMLEGDEFEHELGQRDGTLAHAVERLVALYAARRGFCMREIVQTEMSAENG